MNTKRFIANSTIIRKFHGVVRLENPKLEIIRKMYFCLTLIFLNFGTIWLMISYVIASEVYHNMDMFLIFYMMMATVVQCCLKVINNGVYSHHYISLNEQIKEIDEYFQNGSNGLKIIMKYEKQSAYIFRIIRILFGSLGLLYCSQPFILAERTLMYEFHFPEFINWKENSTHFWIISIYQILITLYLMNGNVSCEILCSCYLHTIYGYLTIIRDEISSLKGITHPMNTIQYKQLNFILKIYDGVNR